MNNNKIKYKKAKPTRAEDTLKRKHDETLALMQSMNKKQESEAELEKRLAKQRRAARLKAMNQNSHDVSERGSRENS